MTQSNIIVASLFDVSSDMSPMTIRATICRLEREMHRLPGKFTELPLEHLFAPGVYIRKIFVPKNNIIVGKLHRHSHANIIAQGKVSVVTEFESAVYTSYCQFTTPAATKRALVSLEDTIWVGVHLNPDNITDLDALEKLIIAKKYGELGLEDPVLEPEGELVCG